MIAVFSEVNEHIRATDEKNIITAGSFIALISVVIAVLLKDIAEINWVYLMFALFILAVGFCVYMLQLWYREWKEHYLGICYNIASSFNLEDKFVPFWLRRHRSETRFSVDKFLLIMTQLINATVASYSIYLLYNLLHFFPFYIRVIIVIGLIVAILLPERFGPAKVY